jgi:long-chain acyl-CoA synthetase
MMTMLDALKRARQTARNRTATICDGRRRTWGEVYDRCERLVGGLRALGLEDGDRVAILAANSDTYVEAYLALPSAGLAIVPLNTRHAEPELRYALEDSGARVLLTDRDPGALASIVERVIRIPDGVEALLAGATPAPFDDRVTSETVAGLFYTGGTTGASKGVVLQHRSLVTNAIMWLWLAGTTDEDVVAIFAPIFHAAGSLPVLPAAWTGATLAIVPAFDPNGVLDLFVREGVTQCLGVPTMIAAMNDAQLAKPRDLSRFRTLTHGGSPIATEILRRAHAAFPTTELVELYGTTELGPLATCLRHEERHLDDELARSCGQPLIGAEIRILALDGRELPPGEVGEVVVRGPNVMREYWNKPEQTAAVLKNGWYQTGDLGRMDENGYVFLVDRAKDMIVTGGENVYSTEVEDALYRHPAVLEAAVFGIPDDRWGESVHAVVVPRAHVTPDELIAFCRERIAGYKVPKSIDLRSDPLPKSGPGKILKRELRAPFWDGRTRLVN